MVSAILETSVFACFFTAGGYPCTPQPTQKPDEPKLHQRQRRPTPSRRHTLGGGLGEGNKEDILPPSQTLCLRLEERQPCNDGDHHSGRYPRPGRGRGFGVGEDPPFPWKGKGGTGGLGYEESDINGIQYIYTRNRSISSMFGIEHIKFLSLTVIFPKVLVPLALAILTAMAWWMRSSSALQEI